VSAALVEVRDLRFRWPRTAADCLDIAELRIERGEAVFVHGPSGCGKSTLLSLMAGVLLAQAGCVELLGQDWRGIPPSRRDRHRADHVGYIFQQFNLLPYLGVRDNVLAPCRFSARRAQAAAQRDGSAEAGAERWLDAMGLTSELWRRPASDLSVGQQQRVAAARALVGHPEVVIADEPTSALDEERRESFVALLLEACRASGSALVFVSHDHRPAARFDRRIELPAINRAASGAAGRAAA